MDYSTIRRQRGISLSGLLIWSFILVMVAILGMKVAPLYIDHASIKKALVAISNDPDLKQAASREIRRSFDKRMLIDNINVVRGSDIQFSKEKGQTVLKINYSVKTPLFSNISLFFDFNVTSK